MAEKKPGSGSTGNDFDQFLENCPKSDTSDANIRVTGSVLRTDNAKSFLLQTTSGATIELPRASVETFEHVNAGNGAFMATLSLNPSSLDQAVANRLRDEAMKSPFEKLPPLDKNPPFDTLKEIGGGDTIKEQPYDTLKEIGGGDTIKEQPFDTLKEIGGGDTVKETISDTLKETAGDQTLVEVPGSIMQPELQPVERAAMSVQPQMAATALPANAQTLKELPAETIKEVPADQTYKEIIADHTIKEVIADHTHKEIIKDVIGEGTGIADSLYEGRPDIPGGLTYPAAGGLVSGAPFVLATPHQASQGAVAQQMLAAQALQGRLGF
jgi:hypothetical protein